MKQPDAMPTATSPLPRFPRRIVVAGTSSVGKTTTARRLAAMASLPHVELDALYWEANWTPADTPVFRQRVDEATSGDAWVADGGYAQARDLTWGRAEHLIWLDYSMPRALWQLTGRTIRRIRRKEELWNGNRERLHQFLLSRDSLYWWIIKTHRSKRRRYPQYFAQPEMQHLNIAHVRSPRELERHLEALQRLLRRESSFNSQASNVT